MLVGELAHERRRNERPAELATEGPMQKERKFRFFPVRLFFEDGDALRMFVERGDAGVASYRTPTALNAAIVNSVGNGWRIALVLEPDMLADGTALQQVGHAFGHLLRRQYDLPYGSVEVILADGPNPRIVWDFQQAHGANLAKSELVEPSSSASYVSAFRTAGVTQSISLDQIARLPI